MRNGLHVNYPLFLSDFNGIWIFSTDVRNIRKYQISKKFVQWERSCPMRSDGRTDRRRDTTRNFSQFCESAWKDIITPIYGFLTWFLVLRVVCRSGVREERFTGRTPWTLEDIVVCCVDQNNRELHNSYYSPDIIHDGYQIIQQRLHMACIMKGTLKHTKIAMGNSEEKMLVCLPQSWYEGN
jgi:hypothetical protein